MKLKGVIRIDAGRMHGYQGRVYFRGPKATQWFSDKRYGGSMNAQQACCRWIAEWHARVGKPYIQDVRVVILPTAIPKNTDRLTRRHHGECNGHTLFVEARRHG